MDMASRVLESKPVSLYEVKEVLKGRKAEKELNYEQDLTMKFVDKYAKLTEKQTADLLAALAEVPFLKDNAMLRFEIANVVPTRIEQLQLIIPKTITPGEEELNQVVELTKKFEDKLE